MNTDLSLWDFSCTVYSAPQVQSACLYLQDEYHFDIPLLLFCCWSGVRYGAVSKELLQQSVDFSNDWSLRTVRALRSIRRDMKHDYKPEWPIAEETWSQLRDQVKALELQSEKLLLEGLEGFLEGRIELKPSSQSDNNEYEHHIDACIVNIEACFKYFKNIRSSEPLVVILSAVYPSCREYIQSAIQKTNGDAS